MDDGVLGERARVRAAERASPIRLVAGCAISAGFIHAVALVQHLREALLYGAFFAVVAACQVAWGVWAFRRPEHTRSVAAVAIANLAVALIWGISRTTGVPLVPEVGQREAPGLIDLFATFDELGIVVLVIAILRPSSRLGVRLARLTSGGQTRFLTALVTATLFGALLGGHAH